MPGIVLFGGKCMRAYIADAFTTQKFSGNPAGVVLTDGEALPEEFMRRLAAELRHSETAFVDGTASGGFRIRYFTPVGEVDLCGHATVAAFTVLREEAGLAPGAYRVRTKAGELEIGLSRQAVWMDMAQPEERRGFTRAEEAEFYAAYGLTHADRPEVLEPQAVSTGLYDILLPVRTEEALERAVQNEKRVIELSKRYNVVGFHMFCLGTRPGETARCRNFAPLYAIPEEAATGASNGALTYYLYRRGLLAPTAENRFVQGASMGRPSEILSRLEPEGDRAKVRIGGQAAIVLRLELLP